MRKKFVRSLLALCVSAATLPAFAQPAIPREYVEHPGFSIGMNFGMSDLWGDVGTQGILDHYTNGKYFQKTHFMGGLFGRFTPHPSVAVRLGVNYGTVYATDAWNEKKAKSAKSIEDDAFQRYLRNQDAKTNIWEGTFQVEFFPLRMNSETRGAARRIQPYITFGVGAFHYQPYGTYINRKTLAEKWIKTADLHLEGEGISAEKDANGQYTLTTKLWATNVPLGIGLRFDINKNLAWGIEYLYRITFIDRLDNVSNLYLSEGFFENHLPADKAAIAKEMYDKSWAIDPSAKNENKTFRGNKSNNDKYSSISLMLIYRFNSNKQPWWY